VKELVLGSGHIRTKTVTTGTFEYSDPVFLDINPDTGPDIVWDLNNRPLPFEDESFDEIHAYEVLEHIGTQGDYKGFFEEFSEYCRILKPDGLLIGTVPKWDKIWAWGDPSHTRVLSEASFSFLAQRAYEELGKSPRSDFRSLYKGNLELIHSQDEGMKWIFILKKVT